MNTLCRLLNQKKLNIYYIYLKNSIKNFLEIAFIKNNKSPHLRGLQDENLVFFSVAGAGFEPATSGL